MTGSMVGFVRTVSTMLLVLLISAATFADEHNKQSHLWQFDTAEQQEKFTALSQQIACPECSGSPLAESHSPIAISLRTKLYELVLLGHSQQEILQYFHLHYGGKVMLAPQGNDKYWLLSTIAILLAVILGFLFKFYLSNIRNPKPTEQG